MNKNLSKIIYTTIFITALLFSIPNNIEAGINQSSINSLTNGLVGYWTLDNADTRTTITDKSGNGNNGGFYGGATSSAKVIGKIGQGLKFDGVNDYVNTPLQILSTNSNDTLTVSGWIRPSSLVGRATLAARDASASVKTWNFNVDTNGAVTWGQYDGSTSASISSSAGLVSTNSWVHIAITRTTSTVRIYLNGVEVATGASTVGGANNTSLKLGVFRTTYTNGSIDDVRIYNRALSATEIKQLYAMGTPKFNTSQTVTSTSSCTTGLSCGLVGYWTLDNADTRTTITDKSGNGNNGGFYGGATSSAKTIGKIGQGLKFDGVDDYVNVPYNASLYSTTMSVSFWIKSNITDYTTNGYPVGMYDYAGNNRVWAIYINATTDKWTIITSPAGATAGSANQDTSQSIQTGWHHITAVTSNTGNTWTFYYDGGSPQILTDPVAYSNQNSFVTIGGLAGSNFVNGSLDDVRIYNRALSATEVTQLYNLGR